MLRHYLVVALRNLARQRLHTALAVLVLGLGLACFLAAALAALYLGNFDRQFAKSDRTYVIYQGAEWPRNGYRAALGRRSGPVLAEKLAIEAPELEAVARQFLIGAAASADGRTAKSRAVAATDPAWLDIFDVRAISGELDGALERQGTVLLTPQGATDLFGTTDVIGKTLTLSAQALTEVTVAAVVAPIEGQSHLSSADMQGGYSIVASWDVLGKLYPQINNDFLLFPSATTYVVLPADGSFGPSALNARLAALAAQPLPQPGASITLEARPVSTVATDDLQKRFEGLQNGVPIPAAIRDVVLGLGLLVLGVACLNFVNLMTARSMSRAREIGVRKSVGATRLRIVTQDLLQTAVVVLAAMLLALLALTALELSGDNAYLAFIAVPWSRPALWALLGGVLAGVTAVAGAYPAMVLARVHPVTALRLGTLRAGPRLLRTALVVVQVAAAAFLGVVVLVAAGQAEALRAAVLGRFADPVVLLTWQQAGSRGVSFDTVTGELTRGRGVKGATVLTNYPFFGIPGAQRLSTTPIDGDAPGRYAAQFVGYDYFSVMQIPLIAGRVHSREVADDVATSAREAAARKAPYHIVIDSEAARSLGFERPADAVGRLLYNGGPLRSEVIGVVETVADGVRDQERAGAMYYLYRGDDVQLMAIRVAAEDADAALAHIDSVWKQFAPDSPVSRTFLDDAFANAHRIFAQAGRVLDALAVLAAVIAAAGLFGMAAYVTRRRTREVGLRKTQGASVAQILRMLLADFTKPVLLGNVIAWPFAFIATRSYVDYFAARMDVTPAPFALTLLGSLLIAWLAVGGFVWRAARLRPTVALREE